MEGPPPLSPDAFTITVLLDDIEKTEETENLKQCFRVQLVDKRGSGNGGGPAVQVLRSWNEFVQFDLFARSVAPKFVPPSLPSPETATREELRQCMQRYLLAAAAFVPLTRLKEVQDFTGYTDFALSDRRRRTSAPFASHSAFQSTSHFAFHSDSHLTFPPPPPPSSSPPPSPPRSESFASLALGELLSSRSYRSFNYQTMHAEGVVDEEEERMLEECFRIMDVGAAGYITPEDMQEFFAAAGPSSSSSLALPLLSPSSSFGSLPQAVMCRGRNEPCNLAQFVEIVRSVLRSGKCAHSIAEWIDNYWLMQYQKIFTATVAFVECTSPNIPAGPLHGFDPFELATLLYVLTEAGLRIISSSEVTEWFRERRHQRSCALAMDELSALLDTLSKTVPFSETWMALLPQNHHHHERQRQLIAHYAACDSAGAAEELRALIEARRCGGARCAKCRQSEEIIKSQTAQIAELTSGKESLTRYTAEMEQELYMCREALARLEEEHQYDTTRLEDALLREAELTEALESAEGRAAAHVVGNVNTHTNTITNVNRSGSDQGVQIHLMPCGAVAPSRGEEAPVVLSGTGAVTYEIPPALRLPNEWTLDFFICSARDRSERLVFCDTDERRSCAFVFFKSELRVTATGGGSAHTFRLSERQWYRLRCSFDWQVHTFHVALTEGGKRATTSSLSCGPFAMIDGKPNGVAIVDVYPRTELFVSYCNFFMQYSP